MADDELLERLRSFASGQRAALADSEARLLDAALAAEPKRSRTYGFEDLGAEVVARLSEIAKLPGERASLVSQCLIAELCVRNLDAFGEGLPPRVRERSIETLRWLLPWLEEEAGSEYAYPDDSFLKDYRFATMMTVPCGAQVVDLAERPGFKSITAIMGKSPRTAWQIATADWFRPHTEGRYLDEFNEEGWNRCYAEVVDLYHFVPNIAGMVATSWFYDPALLEISPRLAYLQRVPVEAGALMVCHGTSQFDIDSSTKTSPTRRKLYEEGKYTPQCWSIIWPRERMIEWRERHWTG